MTSEPWCRVVATKPAGSRLWSFFLVNDGAVAITSARLADVKYEWGDAYVGGASPGTEVHDIAPGARALIYEDDGGSETRVDLWLRVTRESQETSLLFEFPKLYRQQRTELTVHPLQVSGPPG